MNYKILVSLFLLLICSLLFFMSQPMQSKEVSPMPSVNAQGQYEINVRMGSPFEEVYQRNPNMFEVSESGLGPGFMRPELSLDDIKKTKVKVLGKDFQTVFELDGGAEDIRLVNSSDIPNAGISNFLVAFPIIEGEGADQKLYERYRGILDTLKRYGWTPYVDFYEPRIFGAESWQPGLTHDGYYIDSFEKWNIHADDNRVAVYFYKDNLLLKLVIGELNSVVEINTAETHYILSRQEEDRFEHWKTYLKQDLVKWKVQRAEAETELKVKGFTIDENYIDAPLPKLD